MPATAAVAPLAVATLANALAALAFAFADAAFAFAAVFAAAVAVAAVAASASAAFAAALLALRRCPGDVERAAAAGARPWGCRCGDGDLSLYSFLAASIAFGAWEYSHLFPTVHVPRTSNLHNRSFFRCWARAT